MGKNLQKVQDMLDGKGTGKIQSGYTTTEEIHKVGDKWVDADGIPWEQKDGYRSKVSKTSVGIFDKVCKDCETPCLKNFDKDKQKDYIETRIYEYYDDDPQYSKLELLYNKKPCMPRMINNISYHIYI